MNGFRVHELPFDRPFPRTVAEWLLSTCGAELPRALVLTPSVRACGALRHALLEASGDDALLLPRLLTPSGWLDDVEPLLAPAAEAGVSDRLRAAVLAPRLGDLDWLRDRPGATHGVAEAVLRLFDELRRAGLDPGALDPDGLPEPMERDVRRVRDCWSRYRSRIPRDALDRRDALARAAAADTALAVPSGDLVLAGFAELDALDRRIVAAAARGAERRHLLLGTPGEAPLTRLFLAAFGDPGAPTHPTDPGRRLRTSVTGEPADAPGPDPRTYPERIRELGDPADVLRSGDGPLLLPCADPESESRTVAALVVERLRDDPASRIGVACGDRALSRRIADQLADAGLDLDLTDGEPLASHAEGRLIGELLRCVLTDLHQEPLLEVLTHPLTDLGAGRETHRRRTLGLERALRGGRAAGAGADALRRRARDRDARTGDTDATDLVEALERALAPLLALPRSAGAAARVEALRAARDAVAPEAPLADAEPGTARAALVRLLDELAAADALLPDLDAAEFAALYRRLAGAEMIRPHRSEFLPVQVTGLLEARLERYDLLILAGLGEHAFPKEPPRRTLFLGRAWREGADLPDWRHDLGLDAELFLRLLHAGDTVRLTWSRERDGQPALPSPLVGRLTLALADPPAPAPAAPVYRAAGHAVDPDADQAAFAAEPAPRRALVPVPRRRSLSHSSLRTGLDCPYRWLLERGLRLREADPLQDELQKKDYGTIVHDALRRFVLGADGAAALIAGDRPRALAALEAAAAEAFDAGAGDLPRRGLWEAAFLRAGPEIVDVELGAADWTPFGGEVEFAFRLDDLAARFGHALPAGLDDVSVEGRIDRFDVRSDGAVRVVDYKTGAPPPVKAVREGEDLQLGLYALAVRLGAVPGADPEAPVTGVYYGLKTGAVGPGRSPHLTPDHDLDRDAGTVLDAAAALLGPDAEYPLFDGDPDGPRAPCRFCGLRGACRVDELRKEASS